MRPIAIYPYKSLKQYKNLLRLFVCALSSLLQRVRTGKAEIIHEINVRNSREREITVKTRNYGRTPYHHTHKSSRKSLKYYVQHFGYKRYIKRVKLRQNRFLGGYREGWS